MQPAQAWLAIWGLVFFSALCILAGAGSILRLAFPIMSFGVGVFLYLRYPILYLGFTWWTWFLTPLVARLADYRSGWDPTRLMLVSPFLVTMVTLVTFLRHLPGSYRQGGLPFILAFISVFYGFLVGLINVSPRVVALSLLGWLSPILFGFHLFVNWRYYPLYRQNIQRTFLWGVFVMGVYGVVQYLVPPEWDRFWLQQVIDAGITTFGRPEPFAIRVWSTMQSPGPFALIMIPGLLLLFNSQEALRFPAGVFGYLTFLLTSVRSAWGGWVVGLLIYISFLKARRQMGLIITILVISLCILPLTTIDPFAKTINTRVQTLSNVEEDGSYQSRQYIYQENLSKVFTQPLGGGIGSGDMADSGILPILLNLGWVGSILYLGGIILILFNLFQSSEAHLDPFINIARASSFGLLSNIIITGTTVGPPGVAFWGFLGLSMAAPKYYQSQRAADLKKN